MYWILRSGKLTALLLLLSLPNWAQFEDPYEDRYFLFPIRPNETNTLAGTMGELRRTHFHNGIDIRTGGRTGLPVHAAGDGYVSRIAVSPGGYGNALYITHTNGTISVYAHLENFRDDIAEFVRNEQYRTQQFGLNLFPNADQFPVSRGDIVALSGNSGSSGGPHLHFDIRNRDNDLLDPLQFGFNEVIDNTPPYVRKIALKTLNGKSRINGEYGRFEFDVVRQGNDYLLPDTIQASGVIGIELYAYDRQDGTRFKTGIRHIALTRNDEEMFAQTMDQLSFSEKGSYYVHTDYRSLVEKGSRFHKLYIDDGNNLSIYETNADRGMIRIKDGSFENLRIRMTDPYGNTSEATMVIKGTDPARTLSAPGPENLPSFDIMGNILTIKGSGTTALIYDDNRKFIQGADYMLENGTGVFLIDLRETIPDSVDIKKERIVTGLDVMVPSGTLFNYYEETAEIEFGPRDLYDTIYFRYEHYFDEQKREVFKIGNPTDPVRRTITVKLKPELKTEDKDRTHVYRLSGKDQLGFAGGEWEEDGIIFYTRNFGDYVLATDSLAPEIRPAVINSDRLVFEIWDDKSGIKEYRATVDGEWVLMKYDPKNRRIWSEKKDENISYSGELLLEVTDNAGNVNMLKRNIN